MCIKGGFYAFRNWIRIDVCIYMYVSQQTAKIHIIPRALSPNIYAFTRLDGLQFVCFTADNNVNYSNIS